MSDDSNICPWQPLQAIESLKQQAKNGPHVHHISTEEDLQSAAQYLHPAYFAVIKSWFDELHSVSPMEELGAPFELDSGCIHVIESGGEIPDALLACMVDYSQLLPTVEDGLEIWKIVAVEDDWVDSWFAPKGMIPDLDAFAERYLEQDPI